MAIECVMHNMDILQVAIGNDPTGLPKGLFPRGLKVFRKRNRNFMNNKSKASVQTRPFLTSIVDAIGTEVTRG